MRGETEKGGSVKVPFLSREEELKPDDARKHHVGVRFIATNVDESPSPETTRKQQNGVQVKAVCRLVEIFFVPETACLVLSVWELPVTACPPN